ncbi:MAG: hypothetical protein GXP11_10055 [Gammaproteobacteria bacterium]|nr:hypothetical protein [Gammaproteobacteria bacterium]
MDLSVIAACQIAALVWGIWAVHNERPYLVVFADGIFYPLAYYQISETGLKNEDLDKLASGAKPPIKVYIDVPSDKKEYFALLTEATRTKPIHYMGERYKRFDKSEIENISRFSINMDAYLKGESMAWHEEYQQFAKTYSNELDNMLFFPLNARYDKHIVAFDKRSMNFVKTLNIPPPDIDEVIRGKKEAKRRREQAKQKNAATAD